MTTDAPAGPPTAPADAAQRRAVDAIRRLLRDEPQAVGFFQAMRLLAHLAPDRAAPGTWSDPDAELARFGVPPSLAFPTSEIASLRFGEAGTPTRVDVTFFGLTGPQGVLPLVYTDHVGHRARARDTAFRDFLDLLHHRLLAFFYRAWEQQHPLVARELGREDRLRSHLLDLAGMGTSALRDRLAIPDDRIAYYAGLLGMRTRPAVGLAGLIADYFGVAADVEQFVGEWVRLTGDGRLRLGDEGDDGRLGFGIVGHEVWHPTARVRLRLGPLTRAQFDAFLPGGRDHAPLRDLARHYADAQVGIDVQLVLARDEVPATRLGVPATPTLGRGTWLRTRPFSRDPDDTIVTLT